MSVIRGKGTGNRGTVKRGIQSGNEKDGLKKLVWVAKEAIALGFRRSSR